MPSPLALLMGHKPKKKSPAIGSRGEGAGREAARKRVSGTSSVKTGMSSNRISTGTQRKAAAVKVPAPPPPDDVVPQEPEKVRFDFKKPATADDDNLSGESHYVKTGTSANVNKDVNMITKFNLKKKKK